MILVYEIPGNIVIWSSLEMNPFGFISLDDCASTYLQPRYNNGFFSNIYISAGQHKN